MNIDSKAEQLVADILNGNSSAQVKLGQTVLAATHLIGAGAALLQRISKTKDGPEVDLVGWSEQITKMIMDECRKKLRH